MNFKFFEKLFKNGYFSAWVIIIIVTAIGIWVCEQNWMTIFLSSVLLTITYFYISSTRFHIIIPREFQVIILVLLYTSLFLWEVKNFYIKFYWWDTIHHFLMSLSVWFIGFLILYAFYSTWKFKAHPIIIVIFAFSFWIACWALWEILEFSLDQFVGFNMQKSTGLELVYWTFDTRLWVVDTMHDLMIDTLWSLIVAITWYRYLVKWVEFKIFHKLIQNIEEKNKKFFNN